MCSMKQLYVCTHFLQVHVHDKLTELHTFLREVNRYLDIVLEKEETVDMLEEGKIRKEWAYGKEKREVDAKVGEMEMEIVDKRKEEREKIEFFEYVIDEGKGRSTGKGKILDEEKREEADHNKEVKRFITELIDRSPQIRSIFDPTALLPIVMLLQVRTSLLNAIISCISIDCFFHPFCSRIYSSGSIAWHIVNSFIFMSLCFFILLKWMHDYSISISLFFAYCLIYKSVDDHSFLFFSFLSFFFFLHLVLSKSVLIISLHTPFFSLLFF